MRRNIHATALLLALLLPACSGGPSYWVTGTDEKGATLIVPPGRFTPGLTITGIKEVIRVPNGQSLADLLGKEQPTLNGPEEEIAPEPEGE